VRFALVASTGETLRPSELLGKGAAAYRRPRRNWKSGFPKGARRILMAVMKEMIRLLRYVELTLAADH